LDIIISYCRNETKEEKIDRIAKEIIQNEKIKNRKLCELAILKVKYENN